MEYIDSERQVEVAFLFYANLNGFGPDSYEKSKYY